MNQVAFNLDGLTPGAAGFFQRELEAILPEVLEAKTPPRNAFSAFPMGTSVPVGALRYTQRMQEYIGEAKIIADYAADIPMADVGREEETFPVHMMALGYQYNQREIEAAAFANQPLERDRGIAVRLGIEQLHNRIAFFGQADVGLYGALNYPTTPRTALTYAIDATSTVAQILGQLGAMHNSVLSVTKGLVTPSVWALPPLPYAYLETTLLGTASDTTLAEFIMKVYKVQLVMWHELEGADASGADLIYMHRPDARSGRYEVPGGRVFQQDPADKVAGKYVWKVPCNGLTGGFHSPYPLESVIGVLPVA